jgi:hypothetical protein
LAEHFNFPWAQALRAHVLGKLGRDLRGHSLSARVHLADRLDQIARRCALQQVSASPACKAR